MFARLYYTTALALLPSVESALKKVEKVAGQLDRMTSHLEGHLEEQAVALAMNSQKRRSALSTLYRRLNALIDVTINTVQAAFDRRETRIIADIGVLRSKLDVASEARDAVARLIDRP